MILLFRASWRNVWVPLQRRLPQEKKRAYLTSGPRGGTVTAHTPSPARLQFLPAGEASNGCSPDHTRPWSWFPPDSDFGGPGNRNCFALLCFAPIFSQAYPTRSDAAGAAAMRLSLEVGPNRISRVWSKASPRDATLSILNSGSESVTVARIETSCPCVTIAPSQITVAPSARALLLVAFDPSGEPDFRGGLSIRVTGYLTGDIVAFSTLVDLEVRAERPVQRDKSHKVAQST